MRINVDAAKKKQIPTDDEAKEILDYLKSNPDDSNAVSEMMSKYNCSKMSVFAIVMKESMTNSLRESGIQ